MMWPLFYALPKAGIVGFTSLRRLPRPHFVCLGLPFLTSFEMSSQMVDLPKAFAPASLLQSFFICLRPQASLGLLQMKNASSTSLKRRL